MLNNTLHFGRYMGANPGPGENIGFSLPNGPHNKMHLLDTKQFEGGGYMVDIFEVPTPDSQASHVDFEGNIVFDPEASIDTAQFNNPSHQARLDEEQLLQDSQQSINTMTPHNDN